MSDEKLYYYFKEKCLLKTKRPLKELNGYIEISKEEYDKKKISKKDSNINIDENASIQSENLLAEIIRLKNHLKDTDYQAIKYAEGVINEEDYAPIKAKRQEWRNQINSLEEKANAIAEEKS